MPVVMTLSSSEGRVYAAGAQHEDGFPGDRSGEAWEGSLTAHSCLPVLYQKFDFSFRFKRFNNKTNLLLHTISIFYRRFFDLIV